MEESSKSGKGTILLLVILLLIGGFYFFNKKDGAAVVSGHPDWAPIMFKSGEIIDGAGPALVKKIFEELGVATSFTYSGTWDEVQAKAKSGEVDVLAAAYKTTEREEYMDYSVAYTTDPVAIFVKAGSKLTFEKNEDLVGKKGVGTLGDSYGQAFDDFIKTDSTFVMATSSDAAFELVRSGKADYFVNSLYAGERQLKASGQTAEFSILPKFVAEENFYITISKKSPLVKYMSEVNRLIEQYKTDGTIDTLIEQYKQQ